MRQHKPSQRSQILEVLDAIAVLSCGKTGAPAASIFLPTTVKEGTGTLALRGTTGFEGVTCANYRDINYSLGEGMTGFVWKTGMAIRAPGSFDHNELPIYGKDFNPAYKWIELVPGDVPDGAHRDFLMVPIPLRHRRRGVLRVSAKKGNLPFTPFDQEILSAIADQIGIAVSTEEAAKDKTRLLDRATRRLSTFSQVAASTSIIDDESLWFNSIAEQARDATAADLAYIHVCDDDTGLRLIAQSPMEDAGLRHLDPGLSAMIEGTFRSQSSLIAPKCLTMTPAVTSDGLSVLLVPVTGLEKVGVLTLLKNKCDYFIEEDRQVATSIAQIAASMCLAGRSIQRQDQFVRTLVHQVGPSLSIIQNYCNEILSENTQRISKANLNSVASAIRAWSHYLLAVINGRQILQEMVRQEPVELAKLPTSAKQWLGSLDELFQTIAFRTTRNITMDVSGISARQEIDIDVGMFEQVLINLVVNALHYSLEDSNIIITAKNENERCQITVSDRGIPIPPDEIDRIFSYEFRGRLVKDLATHGTGIGLAAADMIVKLHGGYIYATSSSPGADGASDVNFTVELPIRSA